MQTIKRHIVGIIIGICIAVTAGSVWYVYTMRTAVIQNTNAIQQIVNFINQNIQQK